jgi:DNA-binding IclR family transcriptional regulator
VISCLNGPREVRALSKRTGFKDARLERVLSKLEREGILEQLMKGTTVLAKPTAIGRFYAALAPDVKERKVNPD